MGRGGSPDTKENVLELTGTGCQAIVGRSVPTARWSNLRGGPSQAAVARLDRGQRLLKRRLEGSPEAGPPVAFANALSRWAKRSPSRTSTPRPKRRRLVLNDVGVVRTGRPAEHDHQKTELDHRVRFFTHREAPRFSSSVRSAGRTAKVRTFVPGRSGSSSQAMTLTDWRPSRRTCTTRFCQ